MAPILSLSKASLDSIRESTTLSVVSIWQTDSSKCKQAFRSGFVYDCDYDNDICTILTLADGLKKKETVLVQFENGQCFEALATLCDKNSQLFAIVVSELGFKPKKVSFSANNPLQCQEVVQKGNFDEENANLILSTGSVGLVGHNPKLVSPNRGNDITMFMHCCSQRLHLTGAPIFNLKSQIVGLNHSQKVEKNLFFSLDLEQFKRELKILFGENMEKFGKLIIKAEDILRAKRRKVN